MRPKILKKGCVRPKTLTKKTPIEPIFVSFQKGDQHEFWERLNFYEFQDPLCSGN